MKTSYQVKLSPPLKVGLLTLVSILILIFAIMWLKGRSISVGERIEVAFKDVDGMRSGSTVQMMGIRIGQVEEIIPVVNKEESFVKVKFVITEPDIKVPEASAISIQQSGIIGEKFLEITPPIPHNIFLPVKGDYKRKLQEDCPVQIFTKEKLVTIGKIKTSKIVNTNTLSVLERKNIQTSYAYDIEYIITKPGFVIPRFAHFKPIFDGDSGHALVVIPPDEVVVEMPKNNSKYTIVEPLRMREFLDIQLESASALKETNERINKLLSDKFIEDVRVTVDNTKEFSKKASDIADDVSDILNSTKGDITQLIALSTKFSENMIVLTNNLNNIVGDKTFKTSLLATIKSMQTASDEVSDLLSDSKLQDSLVNLNSTSKDLSEIVHYINALTKDDGFNNKIDSTITNLNDSTKKLSKFLDTANELTTEEKDRIKKILSNSEDISEDMKAFSKKLNQRFLLLKLMF